MLGPDRLDALHRLVGAPAFQDADTPVASQMIAGYPVGSKTACYNSTLLAADSNADSETMERLHKLAAFWGIADKTSEAVRKIAAAKRAPAEVTDDDLLVCQEYQGRKVRKFAAFDKDSTVEAAIAFYDNRYRYPYAWRKAAAVRALARAEQYGAHLPEYVERYMTKAAGWGAPTVDAVNDAIVARYAATISEVDRQQLEALQDTLVKVASCPYQRLNEDVIGAVVEGLDAFDAHYKLAAHYGVGLELPEEILVDDLRKLQKMAAASQHIVKLQNGKHVNVLGLRKEALSLVDESLGEMTPERLASVLPTLPRPDADMLMRTSPGAFQKTAADLGALLASGGSEQMGDTQDSVEGVEIPAPESEPVLPNPAPAGTNGPITPDTNTADDLLSAVQAP